MPYASLVEFKAAIRATPYDKSEKLHDPKIEILYAYYRHACSQTGLILGRLNDIKPLVEKYGTAFEGGSGALFVTPGGSSKEMSDLQGKKWSLARNDSFILGGIHGHATFYLRTSNIDAFDRADESTEFVFNVTQRELIGLTTFGYSQADNKDPRGVQYKCTNTRLADSATFKAYWDQVEMLRSALKNKEP